MLSLLFLPSALAVPAWNWSSTPVSFHTEAVLEQSYGVAMQGKNNLDARAVVLGAATEYTCTGAPAEKTIVITCHIDWIKFKALAKVADETEKLNQLLAEWETDLERYQVVMEASKNGKLQLINFAGTNPANQRERQILDMQRSLIVRLFCVFDLTFPEKDNQYTRGWVQKGWQPLFTVVDNSGIGGGVILRNDSTAEKDGYLYISTGGEGNLEPVEGTYVNFHLGADTLFDPTAGMLAFRKVVMDGYYTAGSGSTSNVPYSVQTIVTQRITQVGEKGSTPAKLPPGPLAPPAAPAPAPTPAPTAAPAPAPAPAPPAAPAPAPTPAPTAAPAPAPAPAPSATPAAPAPTP